jgi:hypothetical protein
MKIFINRLRWLSAGIYLGMALFAWLAQDNDKKKNINWDLIPSSPGTEAYEPSQKFNDIYNHYKEKENTNA